MRTSITCPRRSASSASVWTKAGSIRFTWARKAHWSKEAKLSYNGNLLVENRHGLIVNTEVFEANGTAERDAAYSA